MTLTEEKMRTRYLAGRIAEQYADVLAATKKKPGKKRTDDDTDSCSPAKTEPPDCTPDCPPPQTRSAHCKGPKKKKASGWSIPPMLG